MGSLALILMSLVIGLLEDVTALRGTKESSEHDHFKILILIEQLTTT